LILDFFIEMMPNNDVCPKRPILSCQSVNYVTKKFYKIGSSLVRMFVKLKLTWLQALTERPPATIMDAPRGKATKKHIVILEIKDGWKFRTESYELSYT
jgi:hypothetical protein